MPLTKKYLKYSPEITLEIFTLVWNKLIERGFNAQQGNYFLSEEYNCFSCKFQILKLNSEEKFGAYSSKYLELETTVQKILGYDPFVKDNFVLPEKWYIYI